MKKIIILLLVLSLIPVAYSANVTDDAKGEKGEILINNGTKTGHQGTWTNIKDVPELKGDKGDKGTNGKNGIDGVKGDKGDKGDLGSEGKAGKDVDPTIVNNLQETNTNQNSQINDLGNRIKKLESTQYVVEGEVRVLDTKKWEVKPFVRYNIERNKLDTVGVRVTFKFGKSYEEKRIEELEKIVELLIDINILELRKNSKEEK